MLSDRLAALHPQARELLDQARARLRANDLAGARAVSAQAAGALSARDSAALAFDLAEAAADPAAAAQARARLAALGDAAGPLMLREAAIHLSRGDAEAARALCDAARPLDPPAAVLAATEVRLAMLADGPAAALALLADRAAALPADAAETRGLRLRLLNARGRCAEALDLALDWLQPDAPPPPDLLAQALHAALMADRLAALRAALERIEARFPDNPALIETLCICAVEDDDLPAMDALADALRPLDLWRWLGLGLRRACHAGATPDVDSILDRLRADGCHWPGPDVLVGLFAYYFDTAPERIAAAHDRLAPLFARALDDPGLQALRLRMAIALSRGTEARRILAALPDGLRRCAEIMPFALYFEARDGRDAAARDGWRAWIAETAPIATEARAAYPQQISLRYRPQAGAILCFVCIYNGAEYIDWFLDHYRRLGVDHFFFCDNASDDGTAGRLLAQPDVSLFHAPGSFAAAGCGIFWINHLMRRFGVGHWCLHVDMDEALVFAGMDRGLTLRHLTRHLDSRGEACTHGAMIDIVPEGFPDRSDPAEPATFESCRWIDPHLHRMPCELPPYSFIKGGVRSRLTGRSLLMTKAPLVRMTPDFCYLVNNHHHTHLRVSGVGTAVLHYKFIGSFRDRLLEAIARREHFQGARFYRQLERSLDAPGAAGPLVAYEGPAQLVALGLLDTTADWDRMPA